jgi:hypothetical protein
MADSNARLWLNRNKIRLLVSNKQAEYFLDYRDDQREKPKSLKGSSSKCKTLQALAEEFCNLRCTQVFHATRWFRNVYFAVLRLKST